MAEVMSSSCLVTHAVGLPAVDLYLLLDVGGLGLHVPAAAQGRCDSCLQLTLLEVELEGIHQAAVLPGRERTALVHVQGENASGGFGGDHHFGGLERTRGIVGPVSVLAGSNRHQHCAGHCRQEVYPSDLFHDIRVVFVSCSL